jgi:hypothetical protein
MLQKTFGTVANWLSCSRRTPRNRCSSVGFRDSVLLWAADALVAGVRTSIQSQGDRVA